MQPVPATRVPSSQKVRCRQIAQADLERVSDLLVRGFQRSNKEYWTNGFARLTAAPAIEDVPRYGYLLESEDGVVGVVILIPSLRGDRIFANLSSWYVEPEWRTHSTLLISMATKLKHVTYVNISPAPHTWRTLEAQGFQQYNSGRSAVFSALSFGRGFVSDVIPDRLPEASLLQAHADMGCVSLVCETDGVISPFVFKTRRLKMFAKVAELIFSRDIADFERCATPLGRWFRYRGVFGFICDGKVSGVPSLYVDGKEPRFFKGPNVPTDLAFTERPVFGE
jgi:hypothetical protein